MSKCTDSHAVTQGDSPCPASAVRVLDESELAAWLLERGRRVVRAHGRFWVDHWGFYRLTHFAARMSARDLRRPGPLCWAFHALLDDEDTSSANAWSPLHLIEHLASYDESMVDDTGRKRLRRCRKAVRLVHLTDPDILSDQGWALYSQSMKRLGRPLRTTREGYLAGVRAVAGDDRRVVLGAMAGDVLLGYLEAFAVEDTAYLDEIYVSEAGLSLNISAFLHFEAARLYRDSGLVRQLCAGPPLPERMG